MKKKVLSILLTVMLLVSYSAAATVSAEELKPATRAEALVNILKSLGKEAEVQAETAENPFSDVPDWADRYVAYAYKNGITYGVSDAEFDSDRSVTAEEYAAFLSRIAEWATTNNGMQTASEGIEGHIEQLSLTDEWDKVFPESDKVDHKKVTFLNRFGITLAADMYIPKNAEGKLPAIAVCGPFGAVKEQSSGIYAQEMAERGFITLAVDPAFTGESGGYPRNVASPDICTEDYGAAVDFLSVQENVDPERIGIIGVCGYGGFALNAATIDTRVKATVASTMYDISRMNANGNIGEADSKEARDALRESLSAQRTEDFKNGDYAHDGGVPKEVPDDFPDMVKNAVNYYTTERGYHERSLNSNGGSTITYPLSFINAPILNYLDELDSAVLLVHGENAHNKFYSDEVFAQLKGDNKEYYVVPDAVHIDLYDNTEKIPFDKIEEFFNKYLK